MEGLESGDTFMPDYPQADFNPALPGSDEFDIDSWLASFDAFTDQATNPFATAVPVAPFDYNAYSGLGATTEPQASERTAANDTDQVNADDYTPANGWLSLLDGFSTYLIQPNPDLGDLEAPLQEVGEPPALDESSTPSSVQPTAKELQRSVILERYVRASSEDESEAPFSAIERNLKKLGPQNTNYISRLAEAIELGRSENNDHDPTDACSTHSNVTNLSWASRANCLQLLGPLYIDEPDSPMRPLSGAVTRTPSVCSLRSCSSIASDACSVRTFDTTCSASSRAPSRRKRTMTNNHKLSRKGTKSDNHFFCTFCGTSFSTKSTWKRHEESIHLMLKTWTCSPHGAVVSMTPFTAHQSSITDDDKKSLHDFTTCWFCNINREATTNIPFSGGDSSTGAAQPIPEQYVATTAHSLQEHCFSHQNARACHENSPAEKTFIRFDHFVRHLRDAHNIDGPKVTFDGSQNPSDPLYGVFQVLNGPKRSRCGFCGETFTNWADRVHHVSQEFWRKQRHMEEWTGDWGFDEDWMSRLQDARLPANFSDPSSAAAVAEALTPRPGAPLALATIAGVNLAGNGNGTGKTVSFMDAVEQLHSLHADSGVLRESSRVGRFPCTVTGCYKAFCLRKDLQRHHRTIHAADKPEFLCPVPSCKRYIQGFTRKDNLKYHIMQLHVDRDSPCFEAVQKILKTM
ncbi:hypothetical protein DRE_00383 [Drechslerella stenobrocha 248]|uniref:C2H2-type domain-containing protein n=1 Tax=Drechslerella stenobrocha 248 TaxID=1043628 RepID=W7IEG4_9PEZI|nr:hypothetical protein DRE_00383 [Drechslerella stenobrocha 248]